MAHTETAWARHRERERAGGLTESVGARHKQQLKRAPQPTPIQRASRHRQCPAPTQRQGWVLTQRAPEVRHWTQTVGPEQRVPGRPTHSAGPETAGTLPRLRASEPSTGHSQIPLTGCHSWSTQSLRMTSRGSSFNGVRLIGTSVPPIRLGCHIKTPSPNPHCGSSVRVPPAHPYPHTIHSDPCASSYASGAYHPIRGRQLGPVRYPPRIQSADPQLQSACHPSGRAGPQLRSAYLTDWGINPYKLTMAHIKAYVANTGNLFNPA